MSNIAIPVLFPIPTDEDDFEDLWRRYFCGFIGTAPDWNATGAKASDKTASTSWTSEA